MTRTRWTDVALAGVVTAGICWEISLTFTLTPRHALTALLLTATGVALAWRRTAPVRVAVLGAAAFAAPAVFGPPVENFSFAVAFSVVGYSAVVYAPGLRAALFCGAVLLAGAAAFSWVVWPGVSNVLIAWIQVGIVFGIGAVMRRMRHTAAISQQRAELAELVREQHAAAAVAAERARIARDLHDVVGHAISVMTVQAGAARLRLASDPHPVAENVAAIEESGREALAEMRRLLGVLRERDAALDRDPQPGLAALEALLEQARAAGTAVELEVSGPGRPLPPGVDLTAYRIVQEALTNVRKHGDGARAVVSVAYGRDDVRLVVSDDGVAVPGDGSGFGLLGMRERAALYGGELVAGPRPGGGFEVRARLPLS
jgi:signal transduction histidine kinase